MLVDQINSRNDSWAVRWHAAAFLADKLKLYPDRSLVHNVGNDNSGTHSSKSNTHDALLSATPINLKHVEVFPSVVGRQAFESFFWKSQGGFMQRMYHLLLSSKII
jgi:hypothetical protein